MAKVTSKGLHAILSSPWFTTDCFPRILLCCKYRGRVTLPNQMNFRKSSKRQLTPPPTPQNGPYLWKSCACISYYLALVPPCIYSTISLIKMCNIILRKWGGRVEGRLEFSRKFIRFGAAILPLILVSSNVAFV